jgi:hypothetical protein
VTVESEDKRGTSEETGVLHCRAEQRLMPDVNAVKSAYGNGRAGERRINRL